MTLPRTGVVGAELRGGRSRARKSAGFAPILERPALEERWQAEVQLLSFSNGGVAAAAGRYEQQRRGSSSSGAVATAAER